MIQIQGNVKISQLTLAVVYVVKQSVVLMQMESALAVELERSVRLMVYVVHQDRFVPHATIQTNAPLVNAAPLMRLVVMEFAFQSPLVMEPVQQIKPVY